MVASEWCMSSHMSDIHLKDISPSWNMPSSSRMKFTIDIVEEYATYCNTPERHCDKAGGWVGPVHGRADSVSAARQGACEKRTACKGCVGAGRASYLAQEL